MKFACDKCHTKYSIADERVKGRILKIRCKSCNHIITVREEKPAPPLGLADNDGEHTMVQPSPLDASAASDEWYVSFDGEQEGPLPLARALERVRAERPKGKEAHCWRPGFFVWLAVEEVPEFQAALKGGGVKAPVPERPPVKGRATGSRPVVGAAAPRTEATGPKAAPSPSARAKEAPAPRATLGSGPVASPREVVDSKPMPLPPPPEPLAPSPMPLPEPLGLTPAPSSGDQTRPEALPYRKASEQTVAASKRAHLEGPAKRPSPGAPSASLKAPALRSTAGSAAPKPQPGPAAAAKTTTGPQAAFGARPVAPAGAEPSPFAAALAQATEKEKPAGEARVIDTGPVPLPPPPVESDLNIGEASGLLNLAHLAAAQSAVRSPARAAVETFGGAVVTPASSNGMASQPPVVVVAGPAPKHAPMLKWVALGAVGLSLVFGVALVYVVSRPPSKDAPPAPVAEPSRRVNDAPIAMADPGAGQAQPGADDPKKTAPAAKKTAARPAPAQNPKNAQKGLSAEQRSLAALYNESGDGRTPSAIPSVPRAARSGGQQISQQSILDVVSHNKRSLNACYDRVLKHDSTVKRARLDMHVKIGISGTVTQALSSGEHAKSELGTCISQTVKRWRFPSSGEEYETEFPIILQAD